MGIDHTDHLSEVWSLDLTVALTLTLLFTLPLNLADGDGGNRGQTTGLPRNRLLPLLLGGAGRLAFSQTDGTGEAGDIPCLSSARAEGHASRRGGQGTVLPSLLYYVLLILGNALCFIGTPFFRF